MYDILYKIFNIYTYMKYILNKFFFTILFLGICTLYPTPTKAAITSEGTIIFGPNGSDPGQMTRPMDIAIDSFGNMYIVESYNTFNQTGNNRIQKFTPDGTLITSWGGLPVGENNGQFTNPVSVVIDKDNFVYVLDNKYIQKFTPDGTFVTSTRGGLGFGGVNISSPNKLAIGPNGNIYALQYQKVQIFNSDLEFIAAFNGNDAGIGGTSFNNSIGGIGVDSQGNMYILHSFSSALRVEVYSAYPNIVRTHHWAGTGTNGLGESFGVSAPNTIRVGPNDIIYVSNSGTNLANTRKYDTDGNFIEKFTPLNNTIFSVSGIAFYGQMVHLIREYPSSNLIYLFRDTDLDPIPTVIEKMPIHNQSHVPLDSNISITFSELVTPTSSHFLNIYRESDNSLFESIEVTNNTLVTTNDSLTYIFSPTIPFAEDATYYISISPGAFLNASGTPYSGIAVSSTWRFTTLETTPPTPISLFPINNATNVTTFTNFIITFNENITTNTGYIYLKLSSDNTIIEQFDVASNNVTVSGTTALVLTPTNPLAEQTAYYITIDDAAVTDISGNAYEGITDSNTWNFTTFDATAPTLIDQGTPVRGAIDVARDISFVYSFDEVISSISTTTDETSLSTIYHFILTDYTGSTILFAISATNTEYITGIGTNTLTFTLPDLLDYDTEYIHAIEFIVYDAAGNSATVRNFIPEDENTYQLFKTISEPVTNHEDKPVPRRQQSNGSFITFIAPRSIDFSQGSVLTRGANGLSPKINIAQKLQSNADPLVVTGMAISLNDPSFTYASIIPYNPLLDIDLPNDGQEHILYVRYFSTTGHRSQDFEIFIPAKKNRLLSVSESSAMDITTEQEATIDLLSQFSTPLAFSRSLDRGMRGSDVRLLQQVLNFLGFNIAETGVGSVGQETDFFGQLTYNAVLKFQQTYANDILAPLALSVPTGFVGPSTIAHLKNSFK